MTVALRLFLSPAVKARRIFVCRAVTVIPGPRPGAGDTFAAGFLYARSEGFSLTDCACFANAAASTAVEHTGAVDGVRDPDEILRRFRAVRELPVLNLPLC